MKFLTADKVLLLHQIMISATGGSHGVRDTGLLESAIANAFSTFGGEDLYPDPISKAAALCYSLVNNHPFVDGNKRIGIHLMVSVLEYREIILDYTEDEIVELGVGIASGKVSRDMIESWIYKHKISGEQI